MTARLSRCQINLTYRPSMSAEESATRDGALLSLGGWLFPVGTAVDIRTLANPSHVFEIGDEARKIHDRHQSFLELEVEYLPALVPLKELVHSGRLPPGIDRERLHGPGRRLRRQMRDDDRIDLFDLTPVLMDAAAETDAFEPRADQLSPTGAWRAAPRYCKGARTPRPRWCRAIAGAAPGRGT